MNTAHQRIERVADAEPSYEQPQFSSAEQAVRFAMSFAGSPPRPASSRMLDATRARSECTALDKAAQAGMVMNVVEGAGRLALAIMTATVTAKSLPCSCRRPCCSGKATNFDWHRAINIIAEEAYARDVCRATYLLRVACILKIFGGRDSSYRKIAEDVSMDPETVSKHHKAILRWLRGAKGRQGEAPTVGYESVVWRDAEDALRSAGIVG